MAFATRLQRSATAGFLFGMGLIAVGLVYQVVLVRGRDDLAGLGIVGFGIATMVRTAGLDHARRDLAPRDGWVTTPDALEEQATIYPMATLHPVVEAAALLLAGTACLLLSTMDFSTGTGAAKAPVFRLLLGLGAIASFAGAVATPLRADDRRRFVAFLARGIFIRERRNAVVVPWSVVMDASVRDVRGMSFVDIEVLSWDPVAGAPSPRARAANALVGVRGVSVMAADLGPEPAELCRLIQTRALDAQRAGG